MRTVDENYCINCKVLRATYHRTLCARCWEEIGPERQKQLVATIEECARAKAKRRVKGGKL